MASEGGGVEDVVGDGKGAPVTIEEDEGCKVAFGELVGSGLERLYEYQMPVGIARATITIDARIIAVNFVIANLEERTLKLSPI